MTEANAEADEALLVGDSLIDIDTGRQAGIPMVVTSHGFSPPEELVDYQPEMIFPGFKPLLEYAKQAGW